MKDYHDFSRSSPSTNEYFNGQRRSEHWFRDNQVYFITARCRGRFPAFASEIAKSIFWDRFEYYAKAYQFTPWVTSLLDNHYHTLGYLKIGTHLGDMMRKIHGSVAKLVNDLFLDRLLPFWRDAAHKDYFDGCIRDETQCRRAYRYTANQGVRHGKVRIGEIYAHTRAPITVDRGVRRALELGAFMEGVPYKRYQRPKDQFRLITDSFGQCHLSDTA